MQSDFERDVTESLAELKVHVQNIITRLDRINGSIQRHEDAIGEIKLRMADCPIGHRVDAVTLDLAQHTTEDRTNAKWYSLIWAVVGSGLTFVCKAVAETVMHK